MKTIKRYLKEASILRKTSDSLFVIALSISAYTLISTYLIRLNLPPGVCPINTRSYLYYTSILLLILAFVLSFFDRDKQL